MEPLSIDPWIGMLHLNVFFASVVIWLWIAARWRRDRRILEYEPRRPVPWGLAAILPAVAFAVLALLSDSGGDARPPHDVADKPWQAAGSLLAAIVLQTTMAALVVGIAVLSHATMRDIGIVASARQLARDLGLGVITFLAAVAPVHAIQAALLYFTEQKELSNHPLVKMVSSDDSQLGVFVLASVAAVIVAPICEEILYRLMLQGWLEKWEDERLRWRELATSPLIVNGDGQVNDTVPAAPPSALGESGSATSGETSPPRFGVAGMPYGWAPILISSALFATAHYGYGPEPVPIFLLAIILGYVYQRKHRIVPCIVAHALFNLLTMVTLWGMTSRP
jgi:membrane protease YdiL (CAAX protease family)